MAKGIVRKTFGTELYRGMTKVARLTSIAPPEITRDDVDVTDHDSPDGVKQYIPGLTEGGEVPIEGHLIPTEDTQTGLLSAMGSDDTEEWTIKFPTTPPLRVTFEGYVKGFKVGDAPVDGKMTFTATIKVTSMPRILTEDSTGLTALVITGLDTGDLDLAPDFATGKREYFANAANADATVTVKPTAVDHTITVNGMLVPSGTASGPIALGEEVLTAITIRAWQAGKAPAVYVVKIHRAGE